MTTTRPGAAPQVTERYGKAGPRRPVTYAGIGVLAAGGLAWVVWAGLHHASPEVSAGLVTWQVRSDSVVDLVVEVRKEPGTKVTCELVARDIDHAPVGETSIDVAGTRRDAFVSARLATSRRAVSAELTDCRPTGGR